MVLVYFGRAFFVFAFGRSLELGLFVQVCVYSRAAGSIDARASLVSESGTSATFNAGRPISPADN